MAQATEEIERPALRVVLGTNVYRLRVMKLPKMSQGDLADRAGLSEETVRLLEQGRDPSRKGLSVRLDTIDAIADALEVDPAELLRWDDATRVFLTGNPPSLELVQGGGKGGRSQPPILVPAR